jgi:hypothetical protein
MRLAGERSASKKESPAPGDNAGLSFDASFEAAAGSDGVGFNRRTLRRRIGSVRKKSPRPL